MPESVRSLLRRLAIAVAVTLFLVAIDGTIGIRIQPVLALSVAGAVAVGSWLIGFLPEPGPAGDWEQPQWQERAPQFHADVRTRRIAAMLSHAQPGRAFDTSRLAELLADLTATRLVASGRAPADDPWADAERHLSPALYAVVRGADRAPALTRKALHAHLKEIDSL